MGRKEKDEKATKFGRKSTAWLHGRELEVHFSGEKDIQSICHAERDGRSAYQAET